MRDKFKTALEDIIEGAILTLIASSAYTNSIVLALPLDNL